MKHRPSGASRDATPGDRPAARLRIAMALYADITFDSRVQREAETLARAGHDVTVHAIRGTVAEGSGFRVAIVPPDRSSVLPDGSSPFYGSQGAGRLAHYRSRVRWLTGYARNLRGWGKDVVRAAGPVDVWHVHDLLGLVAVAPQVRGDTRLVYDSHEIFIETGTAARLPSLARRVLAAYEGHLARRATALITVNEGYEQVLTRRLRPRRTLVVRNCPTRSEPVDRVASPLRSRIGIDPSAPLALYHGLMTEHRGVEELLAAMELPGMQEVHVALLGYGQRQAHYRELANDPRYGGRLHVVDAVPPNVLLEWVAGADVDVIALQNSSLNHWLCTPNKLWESIAAGVPVLVSDFPVMRRVALDWDSGPIGAVCDPDEPASIAHAIRSMLDAPSEERSTIRKRIAEAAQRRWNWETEASALMDLYAQLGERVDRPSAG